MQEAQVPYTSSVKTFGWWLLLAMGNSHLQRGVKMLLLGEAVRGLVQGLGHG